MMKGTFILSVAAGTLSLALTCGCGVAATAHNSQAGALGPTKNACAATAYFPADTGCVSSYVRGDDDVLPLPDDAHARYRPRQPLQ